MPRPRPRPGINRRFWVWLHRWSGLYMAFFLVVAGATGSVLAFYNELNAWLNPQAFHVATTGPLLDPLALLARARAQVPPTVVLGEAIPLGVAQGRPVSFIADPAIDRATGQPFANVPREFFLDPHSGQLLHVRYGEPALWPITRANVLDVIFRLHYSLALPGGIGTWLFGIAALVWTVDSFVGFYLTFPLRLRRVAPGAIAPTVPRRPWLARWKPAWLVRWRGGATKLTFDAHRAGSLWLWPMLLLLAWSSVRLNLGDQIYNPVMGLFFDMAPAAEVAPTSRVPRDTPPALDWPAALARARALVAEQARTKGFTVRGESELSLDRDSRQYGYGFASSADISGGSYLLFDADTGALRQLHLPDRQLFGPWMTEWIVAIHMAQVGGWPVQVLISASGLGVVIVSVTGVLIWWRRRQARRGVGRAAASRSR